MRDDLMTPHELASMLQVSDRTVRRLAADGNIPGAKRIGSQWRFVRAVAVQFVQSLDNPDTGDNADGVAISG